MMMMMTLIFKPRNRSFQPVESHLSEVTTPSLHYIYFSQSI